MSPTRQTSPTLAALTVCLIAVGLWQIGEGLWIYAKARLAQTLLQRAWFRTLAGEANVKPWPWADTWPVARITVPRLGIDQIVLEGAYGRTLAFGPGHVESSVLGKRGTVILTGHRDTHFSFLKQLKPRDEIVVETATGTGRYLVEDSVIVDSRDSSVALDDQEARLILVTCYPFDAVIPAGPLRYVVTASLTGGETIANRCSCSLQPSEHFHFPSHRRR